MPLVDVVAIVEASAGGAEVTSPVSGARGALVHLELVEEDVSLGEIVLGDTVELRTEDGARYVVVARRATFGFVGVRRSVPLDRAPAELVPLLVRSRGVGRLFVREHVVRVGDRLRLRAQVVGGLVRNDDGPVSLDEVI